MSHALAPEGNSDERLIAGIMRGGQQEFGLLYDKYAPMLYGLLQQITNESSLAAELLQKVFTELHRQIRAGVLTSKHLPHYIIALARTMGLEAVKSRRNYHPRLIHNTEVPVFADAEDDEHPAGTRDNTGLALKLTVKEKAVLDLLYFQGLDCNEVAERLGIEAAEVRTTLRAAIKHVGR